MATNNFDPFKYGATRADEFNPEDYGATLIEPSFRQGVSEDFNKRLRRFAGIAGQYETGQKGLFSTQLQGAGELAGFVGDVGQRIGSTITPEPVKKFGRTLAQGVGLFTPEPVKRFAGAVAEQGIKDYERAKEIYPEATANVEAFGNIVALGLAVEGGVAGTKLLKEAGKAGIELGKRGANITKESVIKLAEKTGLDPASVMQRVARISKGKQAKFQEMAGESVGEYLVNRGVYGNIDQITSQLYKRFETSKNAADKALAQLPGLYKPRVIQTAVDDLIRREASVSSPAALSKDFARTRELRNKFYKEGLDMSEINEVKRLYEKNVRLDYVKQNLPQSVARANTIDDAIRNWQFGEAERLGLKNLPEINRETRLARQLVDDLGKEYAGSAGNNLITLTDWIILSGGDVKVIPAYLTKRILSSKRVQSRFAKTFSSGIKTSTPKAIFGQPKRGFPEFIRSTEQ